jgi:hypothetical protein
MRHRRTVIVASAALLLAAGHASAQTCQGAGTFPVHRNYQAGLSAISSADVTVNAATFVSGDRAGYVDVKVGQLQDPARGGSTFVLGLHGATEVSPDFDHRFAFCPGVGLVKEWGPSHIGEESNTYSGSTYYAAVDFGVLAIDTPRFKWIPITGLTLSRARLDIDAQRNDNAVRQTESRSESYPIVHVGFGVVLADRLSIAPRVLFPFRSKEAHRGVQLQLIYSFGPRS